MEWAPSAPSTDTFVIHLGNIRKKAVAPRLRKPLSDFVFGPSLGPEATMIELHHLRYFIAVAEKLNFRRAAERVHIDQTSLSRTIRDLD